jgi:hypothetical protein
VTARRAKENGMNLVRHAALAAALAAAAALVAGCEQRIHTTTQTSAATPTPSGLSAPPVQQADVAADLNSARDPSLPPAEAAMASAQQAQDAAVLQSSKTPNPAPAAETGTDASAHSATTAGERSTEMPLKGQVNDYNTPDRAKEGDQPNTASQEPGGQEAHPGNGATASKAPAS